MRTADSRIVVGLALLLASAVISCRSEQCMRMQLPRDVPPNLRERFASVAKEPIDVETCTVGDYTIMVLGSQPKQSVLVRRGDQFILMADPTYRSLLANNMSLATVRIGPDESKPTSFSYDADDPVSGAT